MNHRLRDNLAWVGCTTLMLMFVFSSHVWAQNTPANSLTGALKRERTLLQAELQAAKDRQKKSTTEAQKTITTLREQIARQRARYELAWRRVLEKERSLRQLDAQMETLPTAPADNVSLSQLEAELGVTTTKDQSQAQRITLVFQSAASRILNSSQIRKTPGRFFLKDGTHVDGTIVHLGVVAAAGATSTGQGGVLIPTAPSSREFEVVQPAGAKVASYLQGKQSAVPVLIYDPKAPPARSDLDLDAKAKPEAAPRTWRDTVKDAAPVGYVILGLGTLALLVMLVRLLALGYMHTRERRAGKRLLTQMHEHHHDRELDDLVKDARAGHTALDRITLQALSHRHLPLELYENSVQATLIVELGRVSRGLSALRAIAAVSPLLGLLGTVIGMITTFEALTVAGSASDPQALSGGIAQALATTQLGLVVAVPALLAYSGLRGWASRVETYIEHIAVEISIHIRELSLLGENHVHVHEHHHGDHHEHH